LLSHAETVLADILVCTFLRITMILFMVNEHIYICTFLRTLDLGGMLSSL
jgi:hypothetical protein